MTKHISIFVNCLNLDTEITAPGITNAMADRPFCVILGESREPLLHGDKSLDDIPHVPLDEMTDTHECKRSSWPRLDVMVRLFSQLWHKLRDVVVRSNHRQSCLWRIPGALLLVYIGGYVFLSSPQLTSDVVPWYIAPSYPSTFAPTIRSTARAAPPPRMAERVLFVIHLAPVLLLWLLEACRHSSDRKIISTETHKIRQLGSMTRYPVIFLMIMPAFGIATAVSLYSAIHYINSPKHLLEPHAGFSRNARSALVAVVLGYLAPVLWALARFGHIAPEWSPVWAWMTFPTLLPATHELLMVPFSSLSSHSSFIPQEPFDSHSMTTPSFSSVRKAVYTMAAVCTVSHAWLVLRTMEDWLPVLLQSLEKPIRLDATGIDHLSLSLVSLAWVCLLNIDLKLAGKIQMGWLKLLLFAVVGTLLCGPGAVLVFGWLVREEALLAVGDEL